MVESITTVRKESAAESPATSWHDLEERTETRLVEALVRHLVDLGVERAFGVSGGAIALFFDALVDCPEIELHHFRHESGAAFAAAEAHFASGRPALVFSTTGPGTLNALNGVMAARWDGAKLILVSGATSAAQRGRWASQETSSYTVPQDALYTRGPIFDFAVRMESAAEFAEIARRLSLGLTRPGRFVAHVCLPMGLQAHRLDVPRVRSAASMAEPSASPERVLECAARLGEGPFAVWAGFGATRAASLVRAFVERTGAPVFCSPRAKGIMPEDHPQYLGVTGLGGHDAVLDYMVSEKPRWVLVLGTRLGEATSFWDRDMVPSGGFLHVDVDPEVPGTAYPDAPTIGIHAEVGSFLRTLLDLMPATTRAPAPWTRHREDPVIMRLRGRRPVRPQVLMQAVQRHVVQGSDAVVLSECGNAFAWTNHHLRFAQPGRYRVSMLYGSMGHAATGVVGAALGRRGKAVAVVGDGSMLMSSEVSTAAQYQAPAVWIVLNDAGYGMCRDGHLALGLTDQEVAIPRVDFAAWARSMGADGERVESEDEIDDALRRAMAVRGPFIVDVAVDPRETSPLMKRFESLISQGNAKNVAGWEA